MTPIRLHIIRDRGVAEAHYRPNLGYNYHLFHTYFTSVIPTAIIYDNRPRKLHANYTLLPNTLGRVNRLAV